MKILIALLVTTACLAATAAVAAHYSTEATITQQKDKGRYLVDVRISQLIEQNGKLTEKLIARPRIDSAPGVPASVHQGAQLSQPDYQTAENVTLDVSWPEHGQGGFAICDITVKLGDKVVSKSKLKVQVDAK
jgi:hypothetical protein